jgi:hypothetical protein
MVPSELAEAATHTSLAMPSFETSGNNLLGYVAGLGVVLGVLALIIIGGRMIHANFTGDPWIAARGMADLPYVILAVVLILGSGSLTAMLFEGSTHNPEENVSTSIQRLVQEQASQERDAAGCEGALRSENGSMVCPDDDEWERLSHTVPLEGDKDPRCTRGDASDCYEYCFNSAWKDDLSSRYAHSPCTPDSDDIDTMKGDDWIWARYHCANLPSSMLNETAASCPDAPDDYRDVPRDYLDGGSAAGEATVKRYYVCTEFPEWLEANKDRAGVPGDYCDVGDD